jgi:cytoskeletal protein CcmA (bactofilin family)
VQLDHLVIEPSGSVNAEIDVEQLTVLGKAAGNIDAARKVEVKSTATVLGEVRAPSVVIEEGAVFKGRIHMDVGIDENI